jgi:hypothetical protein
VLGPMARHQAHSGMTRAWRAVPDRHPPCRAWPVPDRAGPMVKYICPSTVRLRLRPASDPQRQSWSTSLPECQRQFFLESSMRSDCLLSDRTSPRAWAHVGHGAGPEAGTANNTATLPTGLHVRSPSGRTCSSPN